MIQIINPNKETLMQNIDACEGQVLLNFSDGTTCDLKKDPVAVRLFQALDIPKEGILISLSDPRDFNRFVRYLMDSKAG